MSEMGLMPCLSLLHVLTDSSVAKSLVATRGLGKMRHLEVKLLWLQEAVQSGQLVVGKFKGTANIADAMTKYHTAAKLEELCIPHGVVRAALTEATVGPRGVCVEDTRLAGRKTRVVDLTVCDRVPRSEVRLLLA